MLLAARELGVPMIIGSSGDTGSNSRVDMYVRIIKELAVKHALPSFRVGYFYSEVSKDHIRSRMRRGDVVEGLDGRRPLTEDELDETSRIVAMAAAHPYVKLLQQRADVIIGGRSSDSCRFRRTGASAWVSRKSGVLPWQGARVRVVLRRTVWRKGNRTG